MAVLVSAGALMAGCGGGDDGGDAATTAAAPATTAAETTPVETTSTETEATETETETTEPETTETEPEEASSDSTERPDNDGDGTPDVQTFRGKIGDSFVLVGQPTFKKASKEAVKVTVLEVVGPFTGFNLDPGHKLIGIKVRLEGVGTKRFDDPQPGGQLTVTGGETGKQTSLITGTGKNPCDNPSLKLKKGDKAEVCIAYDIPEKAKPRVFEDAASSGYGDTGIWQLR
jgi:hypothetical protein